jgi:anti-anti-sigma factor
MYGSNGGSPAPVYGDWDGSGELVLADSAAPFACEVVNDVRGVRVAPIGDLDLATTPSLERIIGELRARGCRRLTIDLRRVSFADARPLHLILELDAARRAGELELTLLPGSYEAHRIFEVTGMLERLPFTDC